MKGRLIAISHGSEPVCGQALIVDGRVEDLCLRARTGNIVPSPGAICLATVDRLIPRMGGAFVRLGSAQQGFLRDAKGHREGDRLLVQVTSHPDPGKAVPVTRRITRKGVRVIYAPGTAGVNFSRRIRDDAFKDLVSTAFQDPQAADFGPDLTELLRPFLPALRAFDPARDGLVIRTTAPNFPVGETVLEAAALMSVYQDFVERLNDPSLEDAAMPGGFAGLGEWLDPLPDQIVGDQASKLLTSALSNFHWSEEAQRRFTVMDANPFDHFGVLEEIDRLQSPRVDLPSGAWMAVEATRAMVTIDVNTGGEFGGGSAMTANIEAARELPRQLRLRGLGGQMIVDFAPLKKDHRRKIEEVLKAAFRKDPVETVLAGWTPLGNFELQRKRERQPLRALLAG